MKKVAIVSPAVIPSAVGYDIMGMYKTLKKQSIEVKVFSNIFAIKPAGADFINLSRINSYVTKKDIVLYHHCIGWNKGIQVLKSLSCQKIIKYHNVTPAEFFHSIASHYEAVCLLGRQQTKDLAGMKCLLYMADSGYNREELLAAGVAGKKTAVIPPFHNINHLLKIKPDRAVLKQYGDKTANIVMIGRLAPNKGHVTLIESFFALQSLLPDSRLIIAGKEDHKLAAYNNKIRGMISELGLSGRVVITGEVSKAELKSFYLVAQCFLTASEHEGFCVPLVEAMSMKVPIVAFGSSAIPETAGGAGVILHSNSPDSIARTVYSILKNDGMRDELKKKGYERFRRFFDHAVIEKKFMAAIADYL